MRTDSFIDSSGSLWSVCPLGGISNKTSLSVAPLIVGVAIGIVRRESIEPSGVGCLNVSKGCHSNFGDCGGDCSGDCGSPMVAQTHTGGRLP